MPRFTKMLCLMLGLQVTCIALGFWMNARLLIASQLRQNLRRDWQDLAAVASAKSEFRSTLRQADQSECNSDILRSIKGALDVAEEFPALELLLVDSDGQPLFDSIGTETLVNLGAEVSVWRPVLDNDFSGDFARGTLSTDIGQVGGIGISLPDTKRTLVVYLDDRTRTRSQEAILDELVPSAVVSCFWVAGLLGVISYAAFSRIEKRESEEQLQHQTDRLARAQDLIRTRNAVIFGLAKLAESRDPETGQHLERITLYSTELAKALRSRSRYTSVLTPAFIRLLGMSAALHDIGKVGVQDAILLKAGQLTTEERTEMQRHTLSAGDCLREIESRLGASNFLQMAREIALYHHERWDGDGYPKGLSGDEIPLAARIVAIVDVYDALRSRRVYKEPYSHERCVAIIREESGRQFDPELTDVFLEIEQQFDAIACQFGEIDAPIDSTSDTSTTEFSASVNLTDDEKLALPQKHMRDSAVCDIENQSAPVV